jgi:hypothetical protein
MRALIIGSALPEWPETTTESFRSACRALGRELARAAIDLVVGSNTKGTSDLYVVEGAGSAKVPIEVIVCKPEPDGPDLEVWRKWRPFTEREADFPSLSFEQRPASGAWSSIRLHQILAADVVIVIGGNLDSECGESQTTYSAPVLGRPVLIIPAYGAGATRPYARFEKDYERLGFRSRMNQLEGDWAGAHAETVVELVKDLVAKNPYKTKSKWDGTITLAGVVLLLVAWTTVFIYPLRQKIISFFLLLGISVVLGTLLRSTHLVGSGGEGAPRSLPESLPRRLSAGLVLGFGLALLYFAGGSVINGNFKFMTFPNPEDFQRVSVTMSFLGLGAAILLEEATARLVASLRSVVTGGTGEKRISRK